MNPQLTTAIVLIDPRNGRIRLHKDLLCALHHPQNVLLMIDPLKRTMIVIPCAEGTPCANRLHWNSNSRCELYSLPLVRQFCLLLDVKDRRSRRIRGNVLMERQTAIFQLDKAQPVTGDQTL